MKKMRSCRRCGIEKTIGEFSASPTCIGGRRPTCRKCVTKHRARPAAGKARERYLKWYAVNKQVAIDRAKVWKKANPAKLRAAEIKRRYGMTQDDYDRMLASQGGVCALCFGKRGDKFDIDHSHRTGAVRGIICGNCNRGLGMFSDDLSLLLKAVAYLSKTDQILERAT